jgi:hypothetical protein
MHSLRFQRRLNRQGLYGTQKFARNYRIDTGTTKAQAPLPFQLQIGAIATINWPSWRIANVNHSQTAPTAPAGEQTGEKGFPTAARFRAAHLAVSVCRQLLLVALVFCPIDIAFVMVL